MGLLPQSPRQYRTRDHTPCGADAGQWVLGVCVHLADCAVCTPSRETQPSRRTRLLGPFFASQRHLIFRGNDGQGDRGAGVVVVIIP
ncbi:hypothetical protein AcW2_006486 [Taiwanofungus camphoratus]|nr:hypothetical protein AcW2_006486 [Antrodia cinnamomea]